MHGFNTGMAIGALMLEGMDRHRHRENAKRAAGWAAYNAALRDGREGALREALALAMEEIRARDARIAALEVRVEDLEDEVEELLDA